MRSTGSKRKTLDSAQLREIAVAAGVDPRTVAREYAERGSVRGMAGHRVRREFDARGLVAGEP